jgi:hypothetical protein
MSTDEVSLSWLSVERIITVESAHTLLESPSHRRRASNSPEDSRRAEAARSKALQLYAAGLAHGASSHAKTHGFRLVLKGSYGDTGRFSIDPELSSTHHIAHQFTESGGVPDASLFCVLAS